MSKHQAPHAPPREVPPSHIVRDQSEIANFLSDPATHGGDIEDVRRIDTHGAMVFLAGDRAYKVKRAVSYPYMDFSTLEKRRTACERELTLNRRTAPDVYQGMSAIVRQSDGTLTMNAVGDVIEWMVVMRRFDEDGLLDRMAESGHLTPDILRDLTDEIVVFHHDAEILKGDDGTHGGGADGLRWALEETIGELREHPRLFPPDAVNELQDASAKSLGAISQLLDKRLQDGFVRRCHGDLHLRNVCLIEDRPTIFDAIEFNDRIACIDTLYDLSFLLMDLDHRGLGQGANLVLNRYFESGEALEALAALPCFLCSRAAIRAKVSASAGIIQDNEEDRSRLAQEAEVYFTAAHRYLALRDPHLVAIGGLSGSGKTHLARGLAPHLGQVPGAIHLRSDIIRKQLFGVGELDRLPEDAYTAAISDRVYDILQSRTERVIAAGWPVVVDAVHTRPEGRERLEDIAKNQGAAFTGLWLEAPQDVLIDRVSKRTGDASDATADVVKLQTREDTGEISWTKLDATRPLEIVVKEILGLIQSGSL